jgi:hypothetical protein
VRHLLLVSALVLLAGSAVARSEDADVDRRDAHPWAGWVDGSWVRSEVRSPSAGTMTTTQKLVSRGADAYRLTTETTWQDGKSERTTDHGYGLLGYAHTAPDGTLVGKETLELEGTPVECEVWKVRWTEEGEPYQSIAWVAADVEHPVRVAQKGGELQLQLELVDREDWITIDRRKIRCARYQGWTLFQGRRSKVTQWRSLAIPGGHARTLTQVSTPEGVVEHENRVVEFRGERRR